MKRERIAILRDMSDISLVFEADDILRVESRITLKVNL